MAKLKVEIVTPERRLAQLSADEVIAPGSTGLFGVRPGHAPFLSVLQPGALTVKDGATTQVYFVAGGFVEVGPTGVRVLADSAEPKAEIDVVAAQKRLAEAEAASKTFGVIDPRAAEQQAIAATEKKRLEVARG
jgi:F-type H+-transporting ATPase subunit epsilon